MKVLIVDDEPLARSRLRRLLGEISGVEVVGEAADGAGALAAVPLQEPDVVLLDIRLPGIDGLEAAAAMARMEYPPAVIFCTAYDRYAIDAFDAQAIGYLVKPVERIRLAAALESAQRINRVQLARLTAGDTTSASTRSHFTASHRGGVERVPVEAVYCLVAEHKYVTAVHRGGELLLSESLAALEREFSEHFLRVHRSALVARTYLRGLERLTGGGYRTLIEGLEEGPLVSRRHLPAVRLVLGKY